MPDVIRHPAGEGLEGVGLPSTGRLVDLSKATPIGFKDVFCLVSTLLFLLGALTFLFSPLVLLVGALLFLVSPLAFLVGALLFLVGALAFLVGQLLGRWYDLSLWSHPPQPALVPGKIESCRWGIYPPLRIQRTFLVLRGAEMVGGEFLGEGVV